MSNFFRSVAKVDPAGTWAAHRDPLLKNVNLALGLIPHAPPGVPSAPTGDTAATASRQQQDFLKQRRGVLSNIFAGANQSAPAPTVGQKTLLGS